MSYYAYCLKQRFIKYLNWKTTFKTPNLHVRFVSAKNKLRA